MFNNGEGKDDRHKVIQLHAHSSLDSSQRNSPGWVTTIELFTTETAAVTVNRGIRPVDFG